MSRRERVLMAMSGGVDSSAAACLLLRAGYEVVGVTMHLFCADPDAVTRGATCCSLDDVEDARAAAATLGIEHYVLNFAEAFEHQVIDRFCAAYEAGLTPNPCIDCNRYLKFGLLQQRRRELGCDYVATGHYARRVAQADGTFALLRGVDAAKDQAYVLYHLNQQTLAHMLFPLGGMRKEQTRALAAEAGLAVARKPESQDICFVPDGDYAAFIERHTGRAFTSGPVCDEGGTVLGEHRGLGHYTCGQRKGLNLGGGSGEPLYVLGKHPEENRLIVGPASRLGVATVTATDVTLVNPAEAARLEQGEVALCAKASYRQAPVPVHAYLEDGVLYVRFEQPLRACAPGQALVLYDGERVVGGGAIAHVERVD